jgi:hypothetical protein
MSYDQKRRGGCAPAARAAGRSLMPAMPAMLWVVLSAAALAAVACGKEGPPTPPLRAVPAPTKDLAARQRGTHVLLSFSYPQTTPGGSALNGVSKAEVYEAVLQPPAPKAPAGKGKGTVPGAGAGGTAAGTAGGAAGGSTPGGTAAPGAAAGTPAAAPGTPAAAPGAMPGAAAAPAGSAAGAPPPTPQPLDPRQFESLAKARLTLAGKDLGAATLGNQLVIDLQLPEPLPAAAAANAPVHDYAVRTFGPKGDRSELSNQALLAPKTPPPPPEEVKVTGQADGVLVEWKAVPGPEAGGYAIYRRAATERFSSKPLALVKQPETRYLDQTARFGQSYIYSVTAVDAKQPQVESAIRTEQEVHYVDRYPPPVPEELVAVAETGRARLVWRPSEASDLAGYIVYRRGGTGGRGDWVRLTAQPITATTWVDTTVASGQSYDYRVTAIDQTGNESAPSAEVHVAVP